MQISGPLIYCAIEIQLLTYLLTCQATGVVMATILCPTGWRGVVLMLASMYKLNTTTQYQGV